MMRTRPPTISPTSCTTPTAYQADPGLADRLDNLNPDIPTPDAHYTNHPSITARNLKLAIGLHGEVWQYHDWVEPEWTRHRNVKTTGPLYRSTWEPVRAQLRVLRPSNKRARMIWGYQGLA